MIYGAGKILPRFFAPAVQNFIRDELSKQKAMAVSDEKDGNEKCRDYIIHGLIYGLYGGFDPEICKDSLEDGLTADDWRYVKRNLAGNNPYLLKCVTRIKELSVA